MVNDSADVTSSGRSFHVCGPEIRKARLPTVVNLLVGSTRRLVPTERSNRRLGRSATHVNGPRCPGASPWMTLYMYVKTAILNLILSEMHTAQPIEAGQRIDSTIPKWCIHLIYQLQPVPVSLHRNCIALIINCCYLAKYMGIDI